MLDPALRNYWLPVPPPLFLLPVTCHNFNFPFIFLKYLLRFSPFIFKTGAWSWYSVTTIQYKTYTVGYIYRSIDLSVDLLLQWKDVQIRWNAAYKNSSTYKICQIVHLHFLRGENIYLKTKVCDKTQFSFTEHTFSLTIVAMFITCQNVWRHIVLSLDTENPPWVHSYQLKIFLRIKFVH